MAQSGNHLDGGSNWSDIDRSGSTAAGSMDRGRIDETDEVVNGKTQNRLSPPLSNRAAALRGVANPLFRLARPVELGNRGGQVDRAGEINSLLPSEQKFVLPSEQAKLLETLLPSEQSESDKRKAEWLKTLLPKLDSGWWDVAANGKGFIIKQKWREQKRQITQTYPRVSREQFQTLKGSSYAEQIISDRIGGHLDECGQHKLKATRERARCAAARLSTSH